MDKIIEAIAEQIGLAKPTYPTKVKMGMTSMKESMAYTVARQQWRDLRAAVEDAVASAMQMGPSETKRYYPGDRPGYLTSFYRPRKSEGMAGSYMVIAKTSSIGGESWLINPDNRNVRIEVLATDPWAPGEDRIALVSCKMADLR